jgi:DNA gyrase/topoisomerase IV subunit B
MTQKNYTSDNIKVIKNDIKRIKKRPTMYIGSINMGGVYHLLRELMDNSIDEFIAGYASKIRLSYSNEKGYVEVEDDGRGIPNEDKNKLKEIFLSLHSSGKFESGEAYTNSSGLNGVGLTCTTALSKKVEITIKKPNVTTSLSFKNGNF